MNNSQSKRTMTNYTRIYHDMTIVFQMFRQSTKRI